MLIGYARVSTDDQDTKMQIDALKAAGCERIFQEHMSGADANRPELLAALSALRPDDTLVVWKLDRLARSLRHLIEIAAALKSQGIHFRSLTDYIDTSSPAGQFFFHLLGAFAQYERELNAQRVKAAIAARKEAGTYNGFKITDDQIELARRLLLANKKWRVVVQKTGISETRLAQLFPGGKSALGVPQRNDLSQRQKRSAIALYRSGVEYKEICKRLGVNKRALQRAFHGGFRKLGLVRIPTSTITKKLTPRQQKHAAALLKSGKSYPRVASLYGVSESALRRWHRHKLQL